MGQVDLADFKFLTGKLGIYQSCVLLNQMLNSYCSWNVTFFDVRIAIEKIIIWIR